MKKNITILIVAFVILLVVNLFFYKGFYNLQLGHQKDILQQQTKVCTSEIERVVQRFNSDLNYILFSDDIADLFNSEDSDGLRKLQFFYSTYNSLIKNIDIYDNNKHVLNVFRDQKKNFITDNYIAQRQRPLASQEEVLMHNTEYQYLVPVFKNNDVFANILVTIDISAYILSELRKFHLEGYTWQWVIDRDNGQIYSAEDFNIKDFEGKEEINEKLDKELGDILIHNVSGDSVNYNFLTVYSPLIAFNKEFGIAMSVDFSKCMNQIRSNVFGIAGISMAIFLIIGLTLIMQINTLKKKIKA